MYSKKLIYFWLLPLAAATTLLNPPRVLYEFLPTGDIDDTQCNIEDLERANDSQLHVIFQELQQTNFFRHFVVDLAHKCPLSRWNGGGDHEKHEEEEEFECDGGGSELDEEAEPLCTVQAGDNSGNPFEGGAPFESSVLQSLSDKGFSSNAERKTFEWNQQTDMVVQAADTPCDDAAPNLPDNFWMDMCSNIKAGDGTKLVNLALNPERNTGKPWIC